jgi:hypothetical protein
MGVLVEEEPITDPAMIEWVFITGGNAEVSTQTVRMIGWADCYITGERRIVSRVAMSLATAKQIHEMMRKMLAHSAASIDFMPKRIGGAVMPIALSMLSTLT